MKKKHRKRGDIGLQAIITANGHDRLFKIDDRLDRGLKELIVISKKKFQIELGGK